ncbi:hypothetical protein [Luteimonas huabeiensis]|uniref:hypothetical protein n=1 Tax=Luteimonas huabeiensis TaxID=1244513 RepID=UPI000463036B|nr:hypothetical protein [Luteimonas huabeiensis]
MSTAIDLVSPLPASPSTADLGRWLRRGWTLLRAAPLRGCLLALSPILLEALAQAVPVAGIALSKLLVPLASAWVLALLHQRATCGQWRVRDAGRQWWRRLPALAMLAVAMAALVFGFQMLVLMAIAGADQAWAVAVGDVGAVRLDRWQVAGMLVSGMLPALVLLFVPGQVLFSGRSVTAAFGDGMRALVRYRVPALGLVASAAPVLALVVWWPPVLVLYLPLWLYVSYAAWKDVFARPGRDRVG